MKKILIVSNNCLSQVNNNGKTLKNIFDEVIQNKNVCSLYFSYESKEIVDIPTININEKILIGLNKSEINSNHVSRENRNNEFKRILREVIWLCPTWKKLVDNFIKKNNIGSIFFLAGDSIFAYRIVSYLKKRYSLPILLYYTDDYYFKRTHNFFGEIRKRIVNFHIKKAINKCKILFVISPKMKKKYDKFFHMESKLLGISNNYKNTDNLNTSLDKDRLNFTYIGNLGIGRYEIICHFIDTINLLNEKYNKNYIVRIFSNTCMSEKNKNRLKKYRNVVFDGGLNENQVKVQLSEADYLLFVESFDKNMVEITRYSFSTKIMEYLDSLKSIISIGPLTASSIELLEKCSICINKNNYTVDELYGELTNQENYDKYMKNSRKIKEFFHNEFKISKQIIMKLIYENYDK